MVNHNSELRKDIIKKLEQNDINYWLSVSEMADEFLEYPIFAREVILNYFSPLEPTKHRMNFVSKADFESKHFYISGSEVIVALVLLGFKVNSKREANVSKASIEKLKRSR